MNISVIATMAEYDKKVDEYCKQMSIEPRHEPKWSYFSTLDELNMSIKSDPNEVKIGDQRDIVTYMIEEGGPECDFLGLYEDFQKKKEKKIVFTDEHLSDEKQIEKIDEEIIQIKKSIINKMIKKFKRINLNKRI